MGKCNGIYHIFNNEVLWKHAPHDNPSFLATEIVGCSLLPGVVDYTPACHILYILLHFNNLGNSSHQNNLLSVTLIHDDTMY